MTFAYDSDRLPLPDRIESVDAQLAPVIITPSQFYGHRSHEAGELALWRACFIDAIRRLTQPQRALAYREALHWFADVDSDDMGSLRWCCDALGMTTEAVSKAVLAKEAAGEVWRLIPRESPQQKRRRSEAQREANRRYFAKRRQSLEKARAEAQSHDHGD
jgi:hypothetical protein